MALEIPVGFGLAAWRFSLAGDPEEMVTTCGVDLSDAAGDFIEAANNCFRAWSQQFPAAQLDADWTVHGVRLWVGQDGGAAVAYDSDVAGYTGVASGGGPVQNTAVLVKKTTARAGRSGRGRFYWPPFGLGVAGYSPAGVLASGTLADYQGRFGPMRTAMESGSGSGMSFAVAPVLLHSIPEVGSPPAPDAILAFTVATVLATQRRRLRK